MMKKRMIALLLALVMLCCFVPLAAAEEEEAITPEFWVSLEDHLMNMGYGDDDTRTELAVGDEIWISYQDTVPADVYINGSKVHTFAANEWNDYYVYPVESTDPVTLVVKKDGQEIYNRRFTVISSADMYKKILKSAFVPEISLKDMFLSSDEIKDAVNHGFPLFNPFLPFAFMAMLATNFFLKVFSFTRIVR